MLSAARILEELKQGQVSHIVGIPDNASAALFSLLSRDAEVELLTVTREGEAFALAAGLWVGGKIPAVLIQNTGLLESGDSVRGTVVRMRIPLLCLVTFRGYAKLTERERDPKRPFSPEQLSRPELDSAALITIPTLKAWSIPYHLLRCDEDLVHIRTAMEQARQNSFPVTLLLAASTQ